MKKLLVSALLAGSLPAASPANATYLFNLIDEPAEQLGPSYDFVATGSSTLLVFGGYQIPSYVQVQGTSVKAAGSSVNLLQTTWQFTAAPIGSMADQYVYSSGGVNDIEFGGTTVGSYDLFSQTISTVAGTTYTLHFVYTQDYAGSNGLKATVDETLAQVAAESVVPEMSTWAMMLAGVGFIGLSLRRGQLVAMRPSQAR